MRIFQMLPTLVCGDAIGNETLVVDKILKGLRYETKIYAESIGKGISTNIAEHVEWMPELLPSDIIIYHLSIGTKLNKMVGQMTCRVIVIYHNITPPHFFKDYNFEAYEHCRQGIQDVKELKDKVQYCIADSQYNKQQMIEYGYQCKIDVVPIIIPFSEYNKRPDKAVLKKYTDGYVNIIFVGRVAPNKKHEDVIKAFYYYKKYINQKSRLILVGSYSGIRQYKLRLDRYIQELQLEDVVFTGHIAFEEILAYYKIADVFLCMSEHEGFCIPLLEAMYFHVPIIAYADTGITDTLSESGIQLQEKNCKTAAEMIAYLMENNDFRQRLIDKQQIRLQAFSYETSCEKFVQCIKTFAEDMD